MLHTRANLCLALAALAAPSPIAQRLRCKSYERWTAPPPLQIAQREVMRGVMRYAKMHRLRLVHDPRLDTAAQSLVGWANNRADAPLPIDLLQLGAWQAGITDAGLAALALRAKGHSTLAASVPKALSQSLPHLTANRFGVAQRGEAVIIAFASHYMHLIPTPAEVDVGQSIRVAAQDVDPRVTRVTLAVARPDKTITRTQTALIDAAFVEQIDVGNTPGIVEVQIVIDCGLGPQIAAMYPVGVGQNPWAQRPVPNDRPSCAAHVEASPTYCALSAARLATMTKAQRVQAKDALIALVWGLRQAHGLPLPKASKALMTAAQHHGDDMSAHHFFAHVSPTSGDVSQRLGRLEQHFIRVVENIAAATSLDHGFAQWIRSPSHRFLLLDPSVTHIGVGVSQGDPPDDVLMVLVMAQL